MSTNTARLDQKVAAQKDLIPAMYGGVDFSVMPERFTQASTNDSALRGSLAHLRPALLANEERVAIIRAYTMFGDVVADAYAALIPQYGLPRLMGMLESACVRGLDHTPNAPPELVTFIREMERIPAWLDMSLVEEGARRERNALAHATPFVIRGAFFATFTNKYAALPMALTGTLSSETAARRVKETATFFTTSVLPGALRRYGAGFRAAALVRLMHSVVRFNILTRGKGWNVKTHGIPIPQLDQMPAGQINVYLLSTQVRREGRTTFTEAERAIVELARYRCFLLGLPEELLADTPQGIIDMWHTRACTLRRGFDDATCGSLMRATMAADLTLDDTFQSKVYARLERSFAKFFFVKNFADDDTAEAARMGVDMRHVDYVWAAAAFAWVTAHIGAYEVAARIPLVRELADRQLVRKLTSLLERYGHAEYTTNAATYRPVHATAVA